MGLPQASLFCQLKATMPYLFLSNLYLTLLLAQRQKYIFDSTEPILERHLHLTRFQKILC